MAYFNINSSNCISKFLKEAPDLPRNHKGQPDQQPNQMPDRQDKFFYQTEKFFVFLLPITVVCPCRPFLMQSRLMLHPQRFVRIPVSRRCRLQLFRQQIHALSLFFQQFPFQLGFQSCPFRLLRRQPLRDIFLCRDTLSVSSADFLFIRLPVVLLRDIPASVTGSLFFSSLTLCTLVLRRIQGDQRQPEQL